MTQLLDVLDSMYNKTQTPKESRDPSKCQALEDSVDEILENFPHFFKHLKISENDVKEIIYFLCRMVNMPDNLQGALLIKPCIEYLMRCASFELKKPFEIIERIDSITECWFSAIKEMSKDIQTFHKKPHINDSPLFRFHLDSYKDAKVDDKSTPSLYEAYAYSLHKAIRFNEGQLSRDVNPISCSTHDDYVRSARFFFRYISIEIKNRTTHPDGITKECIDDLARGYDREELGKHDIPLSDIARNYKKMFIALIRHKLINPRDVDSHRSYVGRERDTENVLDPGTPDGDIRILRKDGKRPEIKAKLYLPEEEETGTEEDEGERELRKFEATYGFMAYDVPIPPEKLSRKPTIKKAWEDLINLGSFNFPWDSRFLNLFHYSIIQIELGEAWGKSSLHNAIILYLITLIHTGVDALMLLKLKVQWGKEAKEGEIGLIKGEERYYITIPTIVSLQRPSQEGECLRTSKSVWIPLSEPSNSLIPKVLKHGSEYVFSYRDGEENLRRLNLLDINKFIKGINSRYFWYKLGITVKRIQRSFFPLYQRFGLDPLVCTHISGEDYCNIYSSQMHYVYIDREKLERDYLETLNLVNKAISQNSSRCISEGFLESGKEGSFPKFIPGIAGKPRDQFGYGSTISCGIEYFRNKVDALKKAIKSEKDMVRRHNLYNIYTYLCLQLSTGLRPRNNPDIYWSHYDCISGFIMISDKQSSKYHEERTLPVPGIVRSLFREIKEGFPGLKIYVAKYHNPQALREEQGRIFFFVDRKGNFMDFTIKGMTDYLAEIGVDYTLPPNVTRHFMRNMLYRRGKSNDLADMWMGHQHAGREALNITSSVMLSRAMDICLKEVEEMLREMDFSPLRYLP